MALPAPRHWGTIAEALAALVGASLVTRLMPFKRYIGLGSRPLKRPPSADGRREAWVVDALADRLPLRAVCLQRALALQWMLRRRGIDAILHYGVRLTSGKVEAHVWVSCGDTVLIGAPQHLTYTEVAHYPGAGSEVPN